MDALAGPPGLRNSLRAQVDTAHRLSQRGLPCASAHVLGAFINQLEALGGRQISSTDASLLIAQAESTIDQLLAAMTCSADPDSDLTTRFLEGDVNGDCTVNALDEQLVAFRWRAEVGRLLYNERFDLVDTGALEINIEDLQFVFDRHGSTCEAERPGTPGGGG